MSYKPEVIADSSGKWYGNALRFATEREALDNARDLMARWLLVLDCRAAPSADQVNYSWDSETRALVSVNTGAMLPSNNGKTML